VRRESSNLQAQLLAKDVILQHFKEEQGVLLSVERASREGAEKDSEESWCDLEAQKIEFTQRVEQLTQDYEVCLDFLPFCL